MKLNILALIACISLALECMPEEQYLLNSAPARNNSILANISIANTTHPVTAIVTIPAMALSTPTLPGLSASYNIGPRGGGVHLCLDRGSAPHRIDKSAFIAILSFVVIPILVLLD